TSCRSVLQARATTSEPEAKCATDKTSEHIKTGGQSKIIWRYDFFSSFNNSENPADSIVLVESTTGEPALIMSKPGSTSLRTEPRDFPATKRSLSPGVLGSPKNRCTFGFLRSQ